jgi:hypothetical protein
MGEVIRVIPARPVHIQELGKELHRAFRPDVEARHEREYELREPLFVEPTTASQSYTKS